jgi:DNA-binding NtrC family response regulator
LGELHFHEIYKNGVTAAMKQTDQPKGRGDRPLGEQGKYGVLIIDDDPRFNERMIGFLRDRYRASGATTWKEAQRILSSGRFDVVLLDHVLGGEYDGIDVLRMIRDKDSYIVVILVSAFLDKNVIEAAQDAGVDECIHKQTDSDHLLRIIDKAIEKNLAYRMLQIQKRKPSSGDAAPVFESPGMKEVRELAANFMNRSDNLLITGERGSGKGYLARWIHENGDRSKHPYCPIGLPALDTSLFRRELFGNERGAFTGAEAERDGLFEIARGGTIVLDEIGEIEASNQSALLGVVERKEFMRVGGNANRPLNARLISISNRDLDRAIREGRFMADLYDRLRTLHIEMPPLRERREDILIIARQILDRLGKENGRIVEEIDDDLKAFLLGHGWPGNVRELASCITNLYYLSGEPVLRMTDSGRFAGRDAERGACVPSDEYAPSTIREAKAAAEKKRLEGLLVQTMGRVPEAAKLGGIPRESFYRLCKKHGIDPGRFRPPQHA